MGGVALIVLSSDFDAIGTHGQAGQPIAASMGGPLLLRTFHRTSLVTVRERETPPTRRGGTAVKNTHPEQVSYKDPILRVDIISFLLRSQRANSRARAALDNLHSRQKSGSSFRPLHCDLLLLPPWSTWDFPHSKRLMQTSHISWKPPENPGQLDETKVDSHRNCRPAFVSAWQGALQFPADVGCVDTRDTFAITIHSGTFHNNRSGCAGGP